MEPDPRSLEKSEMASPVDIKSPVEKEHPVMAGHDSMVTVRLSEPPSLSVRTDLPVWPSRRSLFGPEYTPTPTSATSLKRLSLDKKAKEEPTVEAQEVEEDKNKETVNQSESKDENSKSLSEELEDAAGSDTSKENTTGSRKSDDYSEDEDDEEVDWEKLQKSEDEQAQKDDNVSTTICCATRFRRYIRPSGLSEPTAVTHASFEAYIMCSLLRCFWRAWRRKTTNWPPTQRVSRSRWSRRQVFAVRDRHRWRSYVIWSMARRQSLYGTRSCLHLP